MLFLKKNRNTGKHDSLIQYLSFVIILIASGLLVSFHFLTGASAEKLKKLEHFESHPYLKHLDLFCRTSEEENQWKYIVIHHSATEKGNAARFDYYHREKRGWEYGLAYHFVIGNGSFSGDGEIEVSERWKKQIHGAHTANMECNRIAIGICLVGDFENGSGPTQRQFKSLVKLVQYLSRWYNIPVSNILLHKQVHQKGTACPGKNFPFEELKMHLLHIASKTNNDSKRS